jgi:protein-tyrosine phosphatase
VSAVLDLTGELPEARRFRELPDYLNLPVLDLTAPTPEQLGEAVDVVDRQVRAGRVVYVHCKAGYSRSAAVVAAYLVRTGLAANAEAALSALCRSRQGIIIRPEALAVVGAA